MRVSCIHARYPSRECTSAAPTTLAIGYFWPEKVHYGINMPPSLHPIPHILQVYKMIRGVKGMPIWATNNQSGPRLHIVSEFNGEVHHAIEKTISFGNHSLNIVGLVKALITKRQAQYDKIELATSRFAHF